jgi:hypothetical protein
MKNHITGAIFDTDTEGRKTIQTWVYSALFILCLITALIVALPMMGRRGLPPDNKRELRLAIQVPSAVQVITRNGELELVEVIQREVKPAPTAATQPEDTTSSCPCPMGMGTGSGVGSSTHPCHVKYSADRGTSTGTPFPDTAPQMRPPVTTIRP